MTDTPDGLVADGPCVIRKGFYVSNYAIGLIVRESAKQVIVREFWLMGLKWSLMKRFSHWKQADIVARADSFGEAEAKLRRATAAHKAHEPAVEAARDALDAAIEAQRAARLAALQENTDG